MRGNDDILLKDSEHDRGIKRSLLADQKVRRLFETCFVVNIYENIVIFFRGCASAALQMRSDLIITQNRYKEREKSTDEIDRKQ